MKAQFMEALQSKDYKTAASIAIYILKNIDPQYKNAKFFLAMYTQNKEDSKNLLKANYSGGYR